MRSDVNVVELVRRAVAEPLMVIRGDDTSIPHELEEWARVVVERYPLWAFRPYAFAALNGGELPTTHPLKKLASSIARDEGLVDGRSDLDVSLTAVIDRRRCALVCEDQPSWLEPYAGSDTRDGAVSLYGAFGAAFPRVLEGPILAYYEQSSDDHIGGYISPYEDIGLTTVNLVEALESCPAGSVERATAKAELDDYLKEIGRRVRGRPPLIAQAVAKQLFEQGRELIRVLRTALVSDIEFTPAAADVLRTVVDDEGADLSEWALRLVLPMFSVPEIRALRNESLVRARDTGTLSAVELFTVQILAHRLQISDKTMARVVVHGWKAGEIDAGGSCIVCGATHGQLGTAL